MADHKTIASAGGSRLPPPGARRTKSQARGEASRNAIMDAASELVLAHGYKGMSIAALCQETGLSATSIYWHFGSKEGVLLAAMQRSSDRFWSQARVAEDLGTTPRLRLQRLLAAAGAEIEERPEFVRMLLRLVLQEEGLEGVSPALAEMRTVGRAALVRTLRLAYEELGGERSEAVAEALADTALALFDGVFIALQIDPAIDRGKIYGQMADALGLLADQVLAAL